MKVKVTLFIAGRIVEEVVDAVDYKDAQEIAKRRNSNAATIVSVTAVFWSLVLLLYHKFLILSVVINADKV